MTYPKVLLQEVAEVKLGRQRSPKHHTGSQMRPYVRAANVGWAGWRLDDVKTMNFTDAEMETYRLRSGDLLLSEASGSANEVGKPAIWSGEIADCAFQNTLIRVRPSGADSRYLLHYFSFCASSGRFAKNSRGVGIFHLGRKALAQWELPLPSITEQRRIAAVLDAADALLAKRREALAKIDSLTQAIFADLFMGPQSASRWPIVTLGEVCQAKGEYGANVPSQEFDGSRPRYLRITDIRDDGSLIEEAVAPGGQENEWKSKFLRPGDIVFARSGATVGKTFLTREDTDPLVFAGYLIRFVPDQQRVIPEYLYQFTRTGKYRAWVEKAATTVAQPNINAKRYGQLEMPLPPLDDQRRFSSVVQEIRRSSQTLKAQADLLDTLFASLQQRAFRGEL